MNSRKTGIILTIIGSILILSAIGLTIYNISDDYRAGEAVSGIIGKFPGIDADEVWGIPDEDMEMPAVTIDGYRYIGKLDIPSLGLCLPVMETWDYKRMRTAPCRYSGSVYKNNMVICAHNYASHFGRLKNLVKGDEVIFTDAQGRVFKYRTEQIETLPPTAVEEMKTSGYDLTLFTCNLRGNARVAVRCRIQEDRQPRT